MMSSSSVMETSKKDPDRITSRSPERLQKSMATELPWREAHSGERARMEIRRTRHGSRNTALAPRRANTYHYTDRTLLALAGRPVR